MFRIPTSLLQGTNVDRFQPALFRQHRKNVGKGSMRFLYADDRSRSFFGVQKAHTAVGLLAGSLVFPPF
jgi:hypothetical protein